MVIRNLEEIFKVNTREAWSNILLIVFAIMALGMLKSEIDKMATSAVLVVLLFCYVVSNWGILCEKNIASLAVLTQAICFGFIVLAYVFVSFNFHLAAGMMLILGAFVSAILIIWFATTLVYYSYGEKNMLNALGDLVVGYMFLAIITILLFAAFYGALSTQSSYVSEGGERVSSSSSLLYFSSSTFFSAQYGDIVPVGTVMRALSQMEVFVGVVIHIIVLGGVAGSIFGGKHGFKNKTKQSRRKKKQTITD